ADAFRARDEISSHHRGLARVDVLSGANADRLSRGVGNLDGRLERLRGRRTVLERDAVAAEIEQSLGPLTGFRRARERMRRVELGFETDQVAGGTYEVH